MATQHPGYLLSDELRRANISQKALAQQCGLSNTSLNKIIRGHRAFTPEIAVRLERVLGKSAWYWLHAQANYDIQQARAILSVVLGDQGNLLPFFEQSLTLGDRPVMEFVGSS